jgi:hypothetical protein
MREFSSIVHRASAIVEEMNKRHQTGSTQFVGGARVNEVLGRRNHKLVQQSQDRNMHHRLRADLVESATVGLRNAAARRWRHNVRTARPLMSRGHTMVFRKTMRML